MTTPSSSPTRTSAATSSACACWRRTTPIASWCARPCRSGHAPSGGGREKGIYFAAFAKDTDVFETMLRRMIGSVHGRLGPAAGRHQRRVGRLLLCALGGGAGRTRGPRARGLRARAAVAGAQRQRADVLQLGGLPERDGHRPVRAGGSARRSASSACWARSSSAGRTSGTASWTRRASRRCPSSSTRARSTT